jgi:hypothetical protein
VGLIAVALVLGAGGLASAQGKGGGSGGGSATTAAGALYGDLYVIERDGAGVPLTRNVSYQDTETGATVTVACVQPLADTCALLPLWGEQETFDPELYDPCAVYTPSADLIQEVKFGRESVSRAPAMVMDKSYAEALKGINSAAAMCEGFAIKLDPAGRLTLCLASETDPVVWAWKTIDAPLENLGLYRAVMTNGCFGAVTEEKVGEEGARVVVTTALDPTGLFFLKDFGLTHLICPYTNPSYSIPPSAQDAAAEEVACTVTPDPVGGTADAPCPWEAPDTPDRTASTYTPGDGVTHEDMLSATVFIAAAADKTSPVTLDEVINVNNYLGVNLWTYTRVKKVQTLTFKYFTFKDPETSGWFTYNQGTDACAPETYTPLLTATGESMFQTASVYLFDQTSSTSVQLKDVGINVCRAGAPSDVVCDRFGELDADPPYPMVVAPGTPPTSPVFKSCGGANWFTQAAEHARKTVWFLHNWRVPEIEY